MFVKPCKFGFQANWLNVKKQQLHFSSAAQCCLATLKKMDEEVKALNYNVQTYFNNFKP